MLKFKSSIVFLAMFVQGLVISAAALAFDHNHVKFDKILKEHVVTKGQTSAVKYKALKSNTKGLNEYLAELSAVKKSEYDSFDKTERLAFLINAYNAFTLSLIVENYPVKSIKDLGGVFSSPWKKKFFKLFGEDFFLDRIEHDMIRKDFQEPRIHFAVNCASKGCPPLSNFAFVGTQLESQFELVTRTFLENSSQNRWNASKRTFEISSIFKWYGSDFDSKFKNHGAFIAQKMGLPADVIKDAEAGKIKYEYIDYDWSLNDAN